MILIFLTLNRNSSNVSLESKQILLLHLLFFFFFCCGRKQTAGEFRCSDETRKKLKAKNTHGEKWTEEKKERRPSHGPMTVALLPRVPNSLFFIFFLSLLFQPKEMYAHTHTHTHKISGCIQRKRRLA